MINNDILSLLFYIIFLIEFSRILLGFFFFFFLFLSFIVCLGSYFTNTSEFEEFRNEKMKVLKELSLIKSIQIEFVKHSLLSRRIIKIDKEIIHLKDKQRKQLATLKQFFIIIRVRPFLVIDFHSFSSSSSSSSFILIFFQFFQFCLSFSWLFIVVFVLFMEIFQ